MNSKCVCCDLHFSKIKKIISLYPCGHLTHKECFDTLCPVCNKECLQITEDTEYDQKYEQNFIDIKTFKSYVPTKGSFFLACYRFTRLFSGLFYVYFLCLIGLVKDKHFCNLINLGFEVFNIKLKNKVELIPDDGNTVYILTHHSFYDAFVVGPLLYREKFVGFLANEVITQTPLKILLKYRPLILTNKNSENTTVKMAEYLNKYGSFVMFPQGFFSNRTIPCFKKGAFILNTFYKIQPIILNYEKNWARISMYQMLANTEQINVEAIVLNKFSRDSYIDVQAKIEEVRNEMSQVSGMPLSRVINQK